MVYDNEYANKWAAHLINRYGNDHDVLQREISGELARFFRLGQVAVLSSVQKALKEADKKVPS